MNEEKLKIRAILNCDGGTLKTADTQALCETIDAAFSDAGHTIDILRIGGDELDDALEEAGTSEKWDTILVAGGDGTASAGAAAAWRHNKTIALLPAGTMNLFSRSMAIPADLDEAIGLLADGEVARVDIAVANGRPFLHQFAVGLHPRAMKLRNNLEYSSRYGKMIASARAMWKVVHKPASFRVHMTADGQSETRRLTAISISNNRFGTGHIPFADRLDEGVLGVYFSKATGFLESTRLVKDIFLGSWKENATVETSAVRKITLQFPNRWREQRATIDGEVIALEEKVELESLPQALSVLVPRKEVENITGTQ